MNIARKLVAAIATASMLITSFVSFTTVAFAETKPTLQVEIMSFEDLQAVDDTAEEDTSLGVKISFLNFNDKVSQIQIFLKASDQLMGQDKNGNPASMSKANLKRILRYEGRDEYNDNDELEESHPSFWIAMGVEDVSKLSIADVDYGTGWQSFCFEYLFDSIETAFEPATDTSEVVLSFRTPEGYTYQSGDISVDTGAAPNGSQRLQITEVIDGEVALESLTPSKGTIDVKIIEPTSGGSDPVVDVLAPATTIENNAGLNNGRRWTVVADPTDLNNGNITVEIKNTTLDEGDAETTGVQTLTVDSSASAFGDGAVTFDVFMFIKNAACFDDVFTLTVSNGTANDTN